MNRLSAAHTMGFGGEVAMEEQMNQIEIPNRPLSGNQQLNWQEIRTFRFLVSASKKLCLGTVFHSTVFHSDFR